jgi:hypothetical protein
MSKNPILKPGVGISITADQRALIGFAHRGVSQRLPNNTSLASLISFLRKLDGSPAQIPIDYEELVLQLTEHNFVKWVDSDVKQISARTIIQQSLHKEVSGPELRLFAWGEVDSEPADILKRANVKIAIYGDNRLALSLFWLLQNSGYCSTYFYSLDRKVRKIKTNHLNSLGVDLSDLGLEFAEFGNKTAKNSRFLKGIGEKSDGISLVISTIEPEPLHLQNWISQDIPHLIISDLSEKFVEIGPLVLPGKTACNNCVAAWRSDFAPELSAIFNPVFGSTDRELPSAALAYLSGFVALQLPQLLAEIKGEIAMTSPLSRSMIRLNLLELDQAHEIFWPPHPKCGCYQLVA